MPRGPSCCFASGRAELAAPVLRCGDASRDACGIVQIRGVSKKCKKCRNSQNPWKTRIASLPAIPATNSKKCKNSRGPTDRGCDLEGTPRSPAETSDPRKPVAPLTAVHAPTTDQITTPRNGVAARFMRQSSVLAPTRAGGRNRRASRDGRRAGRASCRHRLRSRNPRRARR